MIEIVKPPGYATVQDFGFPRGRAWGLPAGGAMDPFALAAANGFVRNPPGAAAIEWALGPLVVRCDQDTELSAIPAAEVRVGATSTRDVWLVPAPAGVDIALIPRPEARFGYLAVRGGIDLPMVLGSRSTYLRGGFGGFEGRRLQAGDRLPIGTLLPLDEVPGSARGTAGSLLDSPTHPAQEDLVLRATRGPQWDRFDREGQERLFGTGWPPHNFGERFVVDRASDRMGYRLAGPPVLPIDQATLPSEPACPGTIQLPDNGQPIVLMPDGPTVGGYPKIAVVTPRDLARLAQCQPGRTVRFWDVTRPPG